MSDTFFSKLKKISKSILYENRAKIFDESKKYVADDFETFGLYFHAKEFLSLYYHCNIDSLDVLNVYLSLWKYEALLSTIKHAKNKSHAYNNCLVTMDIDDLKNEFNMILQSIGTYDANDLLQRITTKIEIVISKLPVTESSAINSYENSYLAVNHDEIQAIVSVETSGTQGKKRIFSTSYDMQSTIDFYFFGMQHILQNNKNKVAMLYSSEREGSVGYLMQAALQKQNINFRIFPFSNDFIELTQELIKYKPTCIIGIPWHTLTLSAYASKTVLKESVNSVLLSGDTTSQQLKNRISDNFECRVYEHYGLTEFGLAGAVEGNVSKKLAVRDIDTYVEILDKNLNPIPRGDFGEIVITSLTREAMPLIRYRTGDIGKLYPLEKSETFDFLEVIGRGAQGVRRGNQIIHFIEFQDIFYKFSEIADFNLCILQNNEFSAQCLLFGVDFIEQSNSQRRVEIYEEVICEIEKKYDYLYLDESSMQKFKSQENFSCFCLVKMKQFIKIINEDVDCTFIQTPKKKVYNIEIKLENLSQLLM